MTATRSLAREIMSGPACSASCRLSNGTPIGRGKPLSRACSSPGGLFFAVLRWRVRLKRAEEIPANRCCIVDGGEERRLVGLRWLVETAHLSHELQGGRTNLFFGHRRFEIEEGFDVSTHGITSIDEGRRMPIPGETRRVPADTAFPIASRRTARRSCSRPYRDRGNAR